MRLRYHVQVLKKLFETRYFNINLLPDVAGAEMCGTLKNIVALAAGMVDGLGLGPNSKATIMRQVSPGCLAGMLCSVHCMLAVSPPQLSVRRPAPGPAVDAALVPTVSHMTTKVDAGSPALVDVCAHAGSRAY
jgi:hypothetical protein